MGALIPAIITAVLAGTVSSTTDNSVLRIALLVDTSAGTREDLPQLRRGLTALLAAIPDDQEIALISTGRRVETRVPPTLDRKKLQNSVNSLLPGDGPTPLMDAIIEVDERFMRNAGNRSPLFVIITGDGSESSKLVEGETFNRWLTTLQRRRVVAHAIVLKKGNGIPEVIAAAVARITGGYFEAVGTGALLATRLQSLGEQIAASITNHPK